MKPCPIMQQIVEALANQHGVDLQQPGTLLRLAMAGYDQLRIERLPNGCISVAHHFESQGLLIPEPDVCFFVDAQKGWLPVNITQSMTGYTTYAQLSEDGHQLLRYNRQGQADLATFCEQWAKNLLEQQWLENAVNGQASRLTLTQDKQALFALGQVVATPGALDALSQTGQEPLAFLKRHITGDWGDLDAHDLAENAAALARGGRLFSAYQLSDQTKIWVITEWDRSVTTLLLPEEY